MAITAGFSTTRPGQGSTTFMLAAAWDAAESRRVLVIDADPMGGVVEDYLQMDLGPGADQLGMRRLLGPSSVTAEMLETCALQIKARPNLWVIPGLRGDSGEGVHNFLSKLFSDEDPYNMPGQRPAPSLEQVKFDLVLVDLGCPHSYPGLTSPQRVSQVLSQVFQRVFVVIRDSPALSNHNAEVLRKSQLPFGEVVVAAWPSGARDMRATFGQVLRESAPNLKLASVDWLWKPEAALKAEASGRPMPASGLASGLGLLAPKLEVVAPAAEAAEVPETPRRRRSPARGRPKPDPADTVESQP